MSTLSKKKLAKKDLFKIKIRYNKDIKRKGIRKMNKHIEKAKELRNATPMVHNCAQTIMEVYADDLGINKELANHLGCNFGGGMKCGSVCGAITSGLMILPYITPWSVMAALFMPSSFTRATYSSR